MPDRPLTFMPTASCSAPTRASIPARALWCSHPSTRNVRVLAKARRALSLQAMQVLGLVSRCVEFAFRAIHVVLRACYHLHTSAFHDLNAPESLNVGSAHIGCNKSRSCPTGATIWGYAPPNRKKEGDGGGGLEGMCPQPPWLKRPAEELGTKGAIDCVSGGRGPSVPVLDGAVPVGCSSKKTRAYKGLVYTAGRKRKGMGGRVNAQTNFLWQLDWVQWGARRM